MICFVANNIENLGQFIARIMASKRLTSYDVQKRSGDEINQSYVIKLKNGAITNASIAKLRALAKGLGVPEEEVVSIARGASGEPTEFEEKLLFAASGSENWTDAQKDEFIRTVRVIAAGIRAEDG